MMALIKSSLLEIVFVIGGALSLIFLGRHQKKQEQKIDQLKNKAETLENINEVPVNTELADSLKRLRDNGHLRD